VVVAEMLLGVASIVRALVRGDVIREVGATASPPISAPDVTHTGVSQPAPSVARELGALDLPAISPETGEAFAQVSEMGLRSETTRTSNQRVRNSVISSTIS
jgi:hypothetical protein